MRIPIDRGKFDPSSIECNVFDSLRRNKLSLSHRHLIIEGRLLFIVEGRKRVPSPRGLDNSCAVPVFLFLFARKNYGRMEISKS